jgi:hypothetical protein
MRVFPIGRQKQSFDGQYTCVVQFNTPSKGVCTVVILENAASEEDISEITLSPFFWTIKLRKIAWGLNTNDLFVDSADVGLNVFRQTDQGWMTLYLVIETNSDGTESYYLFYNGNMHSEIPRDTIPASIDRRIQSTRERFPNTFKAGNAGTVRRHIP